MNEEDTSARQTPCDYPQSAFPPSTAVPIAEVVRNTGRRPTAAPTASGTSEIPRLLSCLASVGVTSLDVTHTDLHGRKLWFGRLALGQACDILPGHIASCMQRHRNVIIRPRSTKIALVQLDDLTPESLATVVPFSLFAIETSRGSHQAWIAFDPAPTDEFVRRLRRGMDADLSASGAMRMPGSLNFKEKYAPAFPQVHLIHSAEGRICQPEQLQAFGLLAPPVFLSQEPRRPVRTGTPRQWPCYDRCLAGAPLNRSGTGPDHSRADFTWCLIAADWGWSAADIADRLLEVSAKAQNTGTAYALRTATKAAEAALRNRRGGPNLCR